MLPKKPSYTFEYPQKFNKNNAVKCKSKCDILASHTVYSESLNAYFPDNETIKISIVRDIPRVAVPVPASLEKTSRVPKALEI